QIANLSRPGAVALSDAHQAAADMQFLRTTKTSLIAFLAQYDLEPLARVAPEVAAWLRAGDGVLLIRTSAAAATNAEAPLLTAYDRQLRARVQLGVVATTPGKHYEERCGVEYLTAGLRVLATSLEDGGELQLQPCNRGAEPLTLAPTW